MLVSGEPPLSKENMCRLLFDREACRKVSLLVFKVFPQASQDVFQVCPCKMPAQGPDVEDGTSRVLPFEVKLGHDVALSLIADPDECRLET